MAREARQRRGGPRWVSVVIGASVALLVVAVAGVLAVRAWIKSYLDGEEFRAMAGAKASALCRADGGFEEIVWTGPSAYSDGFAAKGYEDAPFSAITLHGIRARLNFAAARRGVWEITGVDINRMTLVRGREHRLAGTAASAAAVAGDGAAAAPSGFLESILPTRVEVGEIAVASANLSAAVAEGGTIALRDVKARLRPLTGDAGWSVSGQGGKMIVPGLPEFAIEAFATRLRGGGLFVTDAAFAFLGGARLTGSGELHFGAPDGIDLRMKIADLDTEDVLGPDWRGKISGLLHGDVRVTLAEGAGGLRKKGTLHVTRGVVEGLGVLDRVADYAKAERFRRLVLHQATADFDHAGDRLEITNLVMQSDGLTRVTGNVLIEGGEVKGLLRVGVTPGTLKWIPGAEQKVFVEPADGFLWTHMVVTGPVANPREDLSARLKAAAVEQVAEDVLGSALENPARAVEATRGAAEAGKGLLDSATKSLDAPADAILEEGRRILDTLTPFLR